MELRSREFKLRLLNREIIGQKDKVLRWKLVNSVVPLVLVILSGVILQFLRKRRYSH